MLPVWSLFVSVVAAKVHDLAVQVGADPDRLNRRGALP